LKRTTEIISINSIREIPSIEEIESMPREKILKIFFNAPVERYRKNFGENLKEELKGFLVEVHAQEPVINIIKLITDKEIENNQSFFEQCAKDYRELGERLILELAEKFEININSECPYYTFLKFYSSENQKGIIGDWKYYFHGFHCGFENTRTKQSVEVPLVFSFDLGDLDPYFFVSFIKSTLKYQPLKINIYEDYSDGKRIITKMVELGKFERIRSVFGNHSGVIVKDRKKITAPLQKISKLKKN
jgi:hypothetical protein